MKPEKVFRGWKGVAVGCAFVVLSLVYNKIFAEQIDKSLLLQIVGYLILGVGAGFIIFATLAAPNQTAAPEKPKTPTAQDFLDDGEKTEEEK